MRRRTPAIAWSFICAVALAGCVGGSPELPGTHLNQRPSPEFRLVDQRGEAVSLSDLRGKAVVLTCLYASCPDFCPVTAEKLRQTHEHLGKSANKVALVAVSVDPEGDTRDAVAQFSARHRMPDAGWYYLTGAEAELSPVWSAYGIGRRTRPPGGTVASGASALDKLGHTEVLYILDGRGRQRTLLRGDFDPNELAAALRQLAG